MIVSYIIFSRCTRKHDAIDCYCCVSGTVFQGDAGVTAEGKGAVGGLNARRLTGGNSMSPPRTGTRGAVGANRAEGKGRRKPGDRGAKASKEVIFFFFFFCR